MSVEKATRKGRDVWRVRWRDNAGQPHSKVLGRKQDAIAYDAEVKRSKRLGTLTAFDGGRETLAEYAEEWAPCTRRRWLARPASCTSGCSTTHILPTLGGYPLRDLTSETIARWQADRLAAGAPVESTRKALTLLGGILQRALEAGRISSTRNGSCARRRRRRPRRSVRSRRSPSRRICGGLTAPGTPAGAAARPSRTATPGGAGRCAGRTSASER